MKTITSNEESKKDVIEWRYDSKTQTLYIRGKGKMKDYSWKDGSYGRPWEYLPLKNVEISEGITGIGANTFNNEKLESVRLPSTLESIGSCAFYSSNLQKIELPSNIEFIDNYAFAYTKLKNIELPQSLKSIGQGAFINTLIEYLDLPDGVTHLGKKALCISTLKELECGYRMNLDDSLSPNTIVHRRDVDWTTI